MPELKNGRQIVNDYLKMNNITKDSLAHMYGKSRVYVSRILSGSYESPKANEFILKVINDFGIKEMR